MVETERARTMQNPGDTRPGKDTSLAPKRNIIIIPTTNREFVGQITKIGDNEYKEYMYISPGEEVEEENHGRT